MNCQRQKFKISSFLTSFFQMIYLLTPFILSICANESVDVSTCLPHSINYHGEEERMHDEAWEMVERRGNQFMVNGQPFYVNGFNTYWLMILAVDQSTKAKVTEVFQQASAIGLTVCRTWGFNDGQWRALQKSPSTYDEDVFKALDFVVSEARKQKIRLIIPLVNNWDAYGGKSQYVKWGNNASGLNLTSDDDFFTDQTIKGYYKTHVKTVLNRVNTISNITYKDDETIFAWELMNEPRCLSDPSGEKLQAWIEEMAFHVKSIDRKHLLGTGLEGFYGSSMPDKLRLNPNTFAGQIGTDFIKNHQVLGIDFASAHMYPGSWLSNSTPETYIQFVRTWMQTHIDDADNILNMPIIFGEFGVSLKDANFNHTYRDMFIDTVYKTMLNSTKRGGSGGGCLVWQLSPEGTDYMDDGYSIVPSKSPTTSNIFSLQSKRLQIFNSRCTWKCHWGCRKKTDVDDFISIDDI